MLVLINVVAKEDGNDKLMKVGIQAPADLPSDVLIEVFEHALAVIKRQPDGTAQIILDTRGGNERLN